MKKINKFRDPWKEFAVRYDKYYTAPGRPTSDEKKIYTYYVKRALKNREKPKALVLGATSELRDILCKLKLDTTIIDINKEMIKAMTGLMKCKNKKEKIVVGNWLKTRFPDQMFDIIVSDLVLCNLPNKDHNVFLKEIKRILKPNGYWVSRFFYMPKKWKTMPVETVFAKYAKLPLDKNKHIELFSHFLYDTYDPRTHIVCANKIKKMLEKYWKNGKYIHCNKKIQLLLNRSYEMWKPFVKQWSTETKQEKIKKLSKYFKILETNKKAKDHLFGDGYTIWFLQSK